MHLLYLDESGSVNNAFEKHFVLAGVAVFERKLHYLIKDIDQIMNAHRLADEELHGSPILGARQKPWKDISRPDRISLLSSVLEIVAKNKGCVAFGVVVEKEMLIETENPMEFAFEQITSRFDKFLSRRNREDAKNRQRGLIVMDKSSDEKKLQGLISKFRTGGTRWGNLRNISEVPMFVDSKASRLIQLADLIAFSLWRRFEMNDTQLFDIIAQQFDADEDGTVHGLMHKKANQKSCSCPACLTRKVKRQRLQAVANLET